MNKFIKFALLAVLMAPFSVFAADEVEELDDVLELVTGAAEGGAAEGCWAAGTAAGLTGSWLPLGGVFSPQAITTANVLKMATVVTNFFSTLYSSLLVWFSL